MAASLWSQRLACQGQACVHFIIQGTFCSMFNANTILCCAVLGQMSQLHVCGFGIVKGTTETIAPFWFFLCYTPSSILIENTILSHGLSGKMSRLHVCGFGSLRGTN